MEAGWLFFIILACLLVGLGSECGPPRMTGKHTTTPDEEW